MLTPLSPNVLGYDATPTPTAVELYKLLDATGAEVTFAPFAMTVDGAGIFWGTLDGECIPLANEGETWSLIWKTTLAGYDDPIYDRQTVLVGFESTPPAIITLSAAKAALDITDGTDDALLTRLIAEAGSMFAQRWSLPDVPAFTGTKTLLASGGWALWAPFASAITAITDWRGMSVPFAAIPGENAADPIRWVELHRRVGGHLTVTGTFGLSAYPAYITGAVIETVKVWYMRSKVGGPGNDTSYVGRFDALPKAALDLMSPLNIVRM